MPIYEYKCENGHVFDVIQKMSDEALTECQECGAPAERVLHPVAVHFKGSGFYNTDYGKKKGGRQRRLRQEARASRSPPTPAPRTRRPRLEELRLEVERLEGEGRGRRLIESTTHG